MQATRCPDLFFRSPFQQRSPEHRSLGCISVGVAKLLVVFTPSSPKRALNHSTRALASAARMQKWGSTTIRNASYGQVKLDINLQSEFLMSAFYLLLQSQKRKQEVLNECFAQGITNQLPMLHALQTIFICPVRTLLRLKALM